ncbi:toxin-antitoxin system TumE family protein [Halorhabdus tiamatea]|nr:DUF6516 family protein [Halorhabdus tiamatea]
MAPEDDVRVLEDTERHFDDGTVLRARVLAVPESEKFPEGIKYRLHYGTTEDVTFVRYDNSHGIHERHTSEGLDEDYDFPGYAAMQDRFWREVEQHRDEIANS